MKIWTLVLALLIAVVAADMAEAGRRCGGRRARRCGGGGCAVSSCSSGGCAVSDCSTGGCSVSPCAGGSCSTGVYTGGYAATNWTYGYPTVGYTGADYATFAGYQPGAFYGYGR
jgi:hypothetical protein